MICDFSATFTATTSLRGVGEISVIMTKTIIVLEHLCIVANIGIQKVEVKTNSQVLTIQSRRKLPFRLLVLLFQTLFY